MNQVQNSETRKPTRRNALFLAGMALNAVAGALMAVPLIGFVFSSVIKRKDPRSWISLGPVTNFPEKQTRMATYRNPFTRPWDGDTANIPCWVRHVQSDQFQVFAVNCTRLG